MSALSPPERDAALAHIGRLRQALAAATLKREFRNQVNEPDHAGVGPVRVGRRARGLSA